MHKSGVALLLLLSSGGVLMVVWANWVETSYVESLLLNAGIACVLFSALYLAQRFVLDRQVKDVRSSIGEAKAEIRGLRESIDINMADLGAELERRRIAENESDDALAQSFRDAPSATALKALLERAERLKAVSLAGIRSEIPGTGYYLRFEAPGKQQLHVHLENRSGTRVESLVWDDKEPAIGVLVHFRAWIDENTPHANANLSEVLETTARTAETAIGARTGRGTGPSDLGPVVELIGPTWAITDDGVEAIGGHHYVIESGRLDEPDWYSHVSNKSWVDQDELWRALLTAEALFGISPARRN